MRDAASLAVAQTCPIAGDVAANISEHLRLARMAAAEGAEVVLYPELSLTGYEPAIASQLAFAEDDTRLAPLRETAAAAALTIIVGAPLRSGTRLHIAAFILRPDGSASIYTKHHLGAFGASAAVDGAIPPAEATVFASGDRNPAIALRVGTASVAICADAGRNAHAQRAADAGAAAYLASMFVIPSEYDADATRLRGYAARFRMVVALANFGGATGGLAAAGRSAIWAETGALLARLPERGAGVAIATTDAGGWCAKRIML
jgi:predicted amidohydrolase